MRTVKLHPVKTRLFGSVNILHKLFNQLFNFEIA